MDQPSLAPSEESAEPEPAGAQQLSKTVDQLSAESASRAQDSDHEEPEVGEAGMRWSAVERLRELDFGRYTDADRREALRLIERIARTVPMRRSRRLRHAADGPVFDKRRTLRSAMRTDGYAIERYGAAPGRSRESSSLLSTSRARCSPTPGR